MFRHGDRAQISRSLSPQYQESDHITNKWRNALPSERTLTRMLKAARMMSDESSAQPLSSTFIPSLNNCDGDEDGNSNRGLNSHLHSLLYNGEDVEKAPYAQLTELGSWQLMTAGQQLRRRYTAAFQLDQQQHSLSDLIYCRSTNMCRTIQSLRSLLYGLFVTDAADDAEELQQQQQQQQQQGKPTASLPAIAVRPIKEETLFPVFDGSCSAMIHRRSVIYPPTLMAERIADYAAFDQRMRTLLGFPTHEEKINWLNVKEILTCHEVHNISWVQGVTAQDVDKVTEITGWSWGVLYKVR